LPEEPLPEELEPVEAPSLDSAALFEPPTEVISPVVEELPPLFEPAPEEPAVAEAGLEGTAAAELAVPEALAAAAEEYVAPEPAPSPEPPVTPVPERRATPRPRMTPEDLLGLGRPSPGPAAKKVKAVRPEDVELDLLGARAPKAKAKPKQVAKAEPVLPDDLLQSLRRPTHTPARTPAATASLPAPAEPLAEAVPHELTDVHAGRETPALAAEASEALSRGPLEVLPSPLAVPTQPSPEELSELDFCLDQGMVVDAAERLQSLEGSFPGDPELAARRLRLEGGRGGAEAPRTALHDILSDDLDSVLDASLGKALTEDMVRDSPGAPSPAPVAPPGAPVFDESGLFSDEQEFFNFADELHTEMRRDVSVAPAEEGREVSLEEIFRDFKKGVEQQLSPEDYETHYNLGIAYKEMGLTDEAIGEFQQAAKDPLHAVECCAMLGLCFLEKGLPQLAVKWYRKGLETIGIKESDRLGLQYALAGVLEQIGDRDGAYRTYLDIYGMNAQYLDVSDRLRDLKPFATS
jgi:tetratricopeptide (TPR) repeat protein